MKRRSFSLLFALLASCLAPLLAQTQRITSPDGRYVITVIGMTYAVAYDGMPVCEGQLGVDIDNRLFESALAVPRGENDDWCSDLELRGEERSAADTLWTPLYGENATVRDHYNQLVLHYGKGSNGQGAITDGYDKRKFYAMDVIVRAYDEGIAFRYHFPETSNGLFLHVTGERTSFHMPEGTVAWYEEWAQGPYRVDSLTLSVDSLGAAAASHRARQFSARSQSSPPPGNRWLESERPLLLQLPSGLYVALLEAAMKDYARGKFALNQAGWLQVQLYGSVDIISPCDTPWRVIMAGREAIDLINHKDLVMNLNHDPIPNGDSWGWVRPGKAFRSTRLDKASIMKSIDYCAEFGIDYVELDAGWYGPEGKVESDATKVAATRNFTMPEICAYARSKGIGVWLYVNQRALYSQLDDILPLYRQWGISGIKFGFVQIGSQHWTTWLHDAVAKCAEHQLMVDIHDEYRPTGLSRTYPNLLTQEGIRGNEEMPDATHNVTLPFTRFLCGPADYTLCYFDRRIKTTRAHQLAMAAVYYSPLQFLFWYDTPFPNGWDGPELQFWRDCPTVFDESIALDGQPGQFIVQARRAGHDWFVGAMTNTETRTVEIPIDFLPDGNYEVVCYNDAPTPDSPAKVAVSRQIVYRQSSRRQSHTPIVLKLQPSGGAALHFRKIK